MGKDWPLKQVSKRPTSPVTIGIIQKLHIFIFLIDQTVIGVITANWTDWVFKETEFYKWLSRKDEDSKLPNYLHLHKKN